MIHTYDQRLISDIRQELLHSKPEEIDVPNVLIVLCDRVAGLEEKIIKLEKGLAYTANMASCLANGIIPD